MATQGLVMERPVGDIRHQDHIERPRNSLPCPIDPARNRILPHGVANGIPSRKCQRVGLAVGEHHARSFPRRRNTWNAEPTTQVEHAKSFTSQARHGPRQSYRGRPHAHPVRGLPSRVSPRRSSPGSRPSPSSRVGNHERQHASRNRNPDPSEFVAPQHRILLRCGHASFGHQHQRYPPGHATTSIVRFSTSNRGRVHSAAARVRRGWVQGNAVRSPKGGTALRN